MKNISRTIATLGVACASAACASQPTPAARAADVAQTTCPTTGAQAWQDMRAIDGTRPVEVQPITTFVGGDSRGGARAGGVKILVQPPETATVDLARALQCRYAQALLGQTTDTSPRDAPLYLPGKWVNVNVSRESNGLYAIEASTDNIDDNLALMKRTREYAAAHGVAIASDMP
jgi:hypothetical protein